LVNLVAAALLSELSMVSNIHTTFCINWNFNGIQLWEFNGLFISVALDSADRLFLAQSFKAQTAGGCMQYY
jgi:hypothetical protein